MNRRIVGGILAPVLAAVVAIVVSSIALLIAGESPATAFREMWETIDSTQSVVLIINRAVPYYVAGVAVAIGFKMNLFNIGAAGQYQLAALLAAGAGAAVSLWAPLHVLFVFVVAIVVGGAYAAIAGILKVWRGVNEVISTIMLNYIAIGISAFLLAEPLRNESSGNLAQTRALPASARLPNLNELVETFGFHLPDGVFLRGFLPFAILLGIGYWVLLNRSRFGFNLRVSGANAAAARTSGVNPKRMVLIDDHPVRRRRRDDRTGPADDRGVHVRRPVPEDARLHRARLGPAGAQPSRRHRRRGARVGDDRAGDAAPVDDRHPAGDRRDPAGLVPARRGHRLRGRQALERRRRGESGGRANTGRADGRSGGGDDMTLTAFPGHAGRRWPLPRWRSVARSTETGPT